MRWERVHVNARARETPEGKKSVGRKGGVWGPRRRWGHTCNAVKGGRFLYVFGGYGEDNCQTNDVHVFDTGKQTWSKPMMKGLPPSPRDSHTCTTVGSKLFVFGGTDGKNPLKDLYVLDTSSNTWIIPSVCGKGPDAREGHSAALVGTRLFIFGGCGKSENNSEEVYYDDLYILDTENFIWERALTSGTPPSARDSHTCASWRNKLIVLGGEDASDYYLSDVFVLDTDIMVWKELSTSGQMLAPRAGHCAMALGRNLFVFGGFTDHRNLYDDLHVLNMDNGIWNRVTTANEGPSARFSAAGDCVDARNGILVLIGGCNGSLEALDDMYYLYTDMQVGNGDFDGRQEKLSFRKELKKKCLEIRHDVDNEMHKIGSISVGSQPGISLYDQSSSEEKTFHARVVDRFPNGYAVETSINGQPLRGILLSCNTGFDPGRYSLVNKTRRMGTDGDVYRQKLKIVKATHQAIKNPHDCESIDPVHALDLTAVGSQKETLGSNSTSMTPADGDAHHPGRAPASETLSPNSPGCNGPIKEAAFENPTASEETLHKLPPSQEPVLEGLGNLVNGHVQ